MLRPSFHMLVLLLGLLSFSVNASIIPLFATLDGNQEVPPNASPGLGHADIFLDDVSNQLSWTITFQNLLAPVVAAHFHEAPIGVNGPVRVPITDLITPSVGSAVISDTFEVALLSGNAYINIHTTQFPAGEIRGQIARAIPLPSTLALLGLALAGLGIFQRRRRDS